MKLDAERLALVKQGKKRQQIVPVTDADWRRGNDRRPVCRYVPGRCYTLSGPTDPEFGHAPHLTVTVADARLTTLGDIDFQQARAEGFRTRNDLCAHFLEQHGTDDPATSVWVIRFDVGDLRDRPRLLARTPSAPSGDYTDRPSRAISDAGEAVSEAEQARQTAEAHARDDLARRRKHAEMPLAERIADLEARARNGEDLAKRALFVINQRLEGAERRQKREGAA